MSGVGVTARTLFGVACLLLALAGCADSTPTVVAGRAMAMLYDPGRVGGLPVSEGPSGPRGDPPPVTPRVVNSDGGQIDRLSLLAIDDIEDFWAQHYGQSLSGHFTPVSTLMSYSSTDPNGPPVCGGDVYHLPNAMYCRRMDTMAWDRAKFLPTARKYFGDMAINGTLAHEYGHALQHMAGIVHPFTRTLVREQQADCFAGVYLQWVAAGNSSRTQLSTADGLNHVLAGLIVIRDPVSTSDNPISISDEHGTALDRVGAFQTGFDGGAEMCAKIDTGEIRAVGAQPDGADWPVTVQAGPRLMLADRALATSAPLGTTFDQAGRLGHILDPRTGTPVAPVWASVSVSAGSAALADALSTAACLMPDAARVEALVAAFPGARVESLIA